MIKGIKCIRFQFTTFFVNKILQKKIHFVMGLVSWCFRTKNMKNGRPNPPADAATQTSIHHAA